MWVLLREVSSFTDEEIQSTVADTNDGIPYIQDDGDDPAVVTADCYEVCLVAPRDAIIAVYWCHADINALLRRRISHDWACTSTMPQHHRSVAEAVLNNSLLLECFYFGVLWS